MSRIADQSKTVFIFILSGCLTCLFFSCNSKSGENSESARRKAEQVLSSSDHITDHDSISDSDSLAFIKPFIPKGFRILERFDLDMNFDQINDVFLILEADTSISPKVLDSFTYSSANGIYAVRPLIILVRQQNGQLILKARNNHLYTGIFPDLWGSVYYPDYFVENGKFGYGLFLHGGGGHSESNIQFEYSKVHADWIMKSYELNYTSDTPTEDGGYDDHEGSYSRTMKDFGVISINNFEYVPD